VKSHTSRSGQTLIMSTTLVIVLLLLATALIDLAGSARNAARRQQQKLAQSNWAEAAVQEARDRLAVGTIVPNDNDSAWTFPFSTTGLITATGTVKLLKDTSGVVIPGRYELITSANAGGGTATVTAVVRKHSLLGPFNWGLCGYNGVDIRYALVDSYNSATDLTLPLSAGAGGLAAMVATNGTGANSIQLFSTGALYGEAIVGPGTSPPSDALSNASTITTFVPVSANPSSVTFATLALPTGMAATADLDSTRTLAAGTYGFDEIDLKGTDLVTCTGPVVIYAATKLQISGPGFVTANNLPANLLIYYLGTDSAELSPKSAFLGAIWAPNAQVQLGKRNQLTLMYGAVTAKTIRCEGNENDSQRLNFFQDRALRQPGADWADHTYFRLIAWDAR